MVAALKQLLRRRVGDEFTHHGGPMPSAKQAWPPSGVRCVGVSVWCACGMCDFDCVSLFQIQTMTCANLLSESPRPNVQRRKPKNCARLTLS